MLLDAVGDLATEPAVGRAVEVDGGRPFDVRVLARLATLAPLSVRNLCFAVTGAGALLGVAEREADPLAGPTLGEAAVAGVLAVVELGEATDLVVAVGAACFTVAGDEPEAVDAEDNDRCPFATDVLAALRLSTAARIWIGPASLSPSSDLTTLLLDVGEGVLVPCEDAGDANLNLLPASA